MADFVCPEPLIAFANKLADVSGEVVSRYFRKPFAIEGKEDLSPVTVADRETEKAMRVLIEAAYPSHGIFGEEWGVHAADAAFVWVLDPIDGTRAFVCGKPVWGTLIALLHEGKPVLGIINQPVLRERWVGVAGRPTLLNGERCVTRSCESLKRAVVNLAPQAFDEANAPFLPAYRALERAAATTSVGGDCYLYGLLAAGFVDVAIENRLKLYDFAALTPVIEGAGGMVTDWQGRPLHAGSDGFVLAAGDRRAGEEALALIRGAL